MLVCWRGDSVLLWRESSHLQRVDIQNTLIFNECAPWRLDHIIFRINTRPKHYWTCSVIQVFVAERLHQLRPQIKIKHGLVYFDRWLVDILDHGGLYLHCQEAHIFEFFFHLGRSICSSFRNNFPANYTDFVECLIHESADRLLAADIKVVNRVIKMPDSFRTVAHKPVLLLISNEFCDRVGLGLEEQSLEAATVLRSFRRSFFSSVSLGIQDFIFIWGPNWCQLVGRQGVRDH